MTRLLNSSLSRHALIGTTAAVLVLVSLAAPRHAEARLRVSVEVNTPHVGVVVRGDDGRCGAPVRPPVVIDRHDRRTARTLAHKYDCSAAFLLDMRRDGRTWGEIRAYLRGAPHAIHVAPHHHGHRPVRCGNHGGHGR